ncbi:MAG: cytochrome b/b6 domain-containing protein [Bacteriovorax sp.]|nr:cytochrome b/b6 domain-containing protein [Rhizobacter sp.]
MRVMHWVDVVCLVILLMSGLGIFNALPALYWGKHSDFGHPWGSVSAVQAPRGLGGLGGVTRMAGHSVDTSGVLGASRAGVAGG